MLTIRPAEGRDREAVYGLLRQVLELHAAIRPDLFISGTSKYTLDEISALFCDEERRSYVAEEDGRVLGYALCELKRPPVSNTMREGLTMYLDDLCVDQSAQGRQIGRRLFEHVVTEARALGCRDVTLNVWEGNDGARAFYEKLGLRPRETQMELML